MSGLEISNAIAGSMASFGFAVFLLFGYWLVFPIVTLIQVILRKTISGGEKVGWILGIVFSWPIFAIGSLIYGLVKYKRYYKAIPLVIVFIIVGLFISGYSSLIGISYDVGGKAVEAAISDPAQREDIRAKMAQMQQDKDFMQTAVNLSLINHLFVLTDNDLSADEHTHWVYLYDNRADLREKDIDVLDAELNAAALKFGNSIDSE